MFVTVRKLPILFSVNVWTVDGLFLKIFRLNINFFNGS